MFSRVAADEPFRIMQVVISSVECAYSQLGGIRVKCRSTRNASRVVVGFASRGGGLGVNQDEADAALSLFQEAALLPELWARALGGLSAIFSASGVAAQLVDGDSVSVFASPGHDGTVREYVEGGWAPRNGRMERGLALTRAGYRGFITEYRMFTPEELARDPYQQEFAIGHEVECEAGLLLASHGSAGFVLTASRSARQGVFFPAEIGTMNRFAARLAGSCDFALRMKLTTARDMAESFSARGEAMALLSPSGASLFHTAAMGNLIGRGLSLREGRFRAADPVADNALQALVARASAPAEGGDAGLTPVVARRPDCPPLVLRCHPVAGAARDFLGLVRSILLVDDLSVRPPPPAAELLARAFGLSPSEARLAVRLGTGATLREAADLEGITYETARTRLKDIYLKTGTKRQSELAVLAARLGR